VTTTTRDGRAELIVRNTGPRIPAYEIPGLFEPFRRLRDRIAHDGGTGLGLSIVRSVAHAHGGDVTARPRDGGGLEVTVTLPRAVPANLMISLEKPQARWDS
jgi:signal transduction histidine kinase